MTIKQDIRQFLESRLRQWKSDILLAEHLYEQIPYLEARIAETEAWLKDVDEDRDVKVPIGKGAPKVEPPVMIPPVDPKEIERE